MCTVISTTFPLLNVLVLFLPFLHPTDCLPVFFSFLSVLPSSLAWACRVFLGRNQCKSPCLNVSTSRCHFALHPSPTYLSWSFRYRSCHPTCLSVHLSFSPAYLFLPLPLSLASPGYSFSTCKFSSICLLC